jgi:hypothetical protein
MPHYEICYLDERNAVIGIYAAPCAGEKQARILAHAMRPPGTRRMEVWDGAHLIYERPQTAPAAAAGALRGPPPLHRAK